ncbi:MAG: 50S ribosomal protein L18a [Thermoplasmatales archaeon]|jgi:large subunit ribosomal protein LX|nr:50S ribosomal protein L18a [Thermoplasmatales archaeon]
MKGFRIKGSFSDARQPKGRQVFTIEVAAEDKGAAEEQALSLLGSKHRLKRWQIALDSMEEITASEAKDHVVQYKLGE